MQIHLYGLIAAAAIFAGYVLAIKRAKKFGISESLIDSLFLPTVIGGVVGARIYHVLDKWDFYRNDLAAVFKVWEGGLAIYGGIIGGLIGILLYIRLRKSAVSVLSLLDLVAPSMAMGQAIGRWGNYFNQEAFGPPTNLPWGIFIDPTNRPLQWINFERFHPTFFYESMWMVLGFLVLIFVEKRLIKRKGALFGVYAVWYGVGRFLLENLRFGDAMLGQFNVAQILSILLFLLGLILIWRAFKLKVR